ncbi:hypothetical protein G6F57_001581 [Rhizopus arrhizus]|uniref:BZIP domain-containing protein n=1 Tax=Rhizopus oryzae TaxID=64495 RepID=A0A9P6X4G3_RHIOR|nr:hypothetical protein G6F23_004325 [Rhizopus arrhizus]KAG1416943.1 hypothetical protein G6F58_005730 [Rhizopus delemar]KAG0762807.1 hypothetical protein G6F24_006515 [Rhizopus arrhizus]KAG0785663.1 hypothetical protein G6F21_009107 [Rhizopus arrhizus]KAG0796113.1 hypothetical protein G6F22_004973 [Rhizopus arrhizus]
MTDIIVNTSSYEDAMNLSDMDEFDFMKGSMPMMNNPLEQPAMDSPIKVRKKPGRKPNPASPALRKAQNRAAQRAFRERKERHMKDLEAGIRNIKEERDRLLKENEKLTDENEILKAENWYLKGIVLSLQLVCLQQSLVIPQHCPHMNEETLGVLAQSIPQSISSYLNVNAKNKLNLSSRFFKRTSEPHIGSQDMYQQQGFMDSTTQHTMDRWDTYSHHQDQQQSDESCFSNMPPLSPMTASEKSASVNEIPRPIPNEPATTNLAAIQSLRLRLRLQAASVHMPSTPAATQPTVLQLAIPHDPRIDLIPTPHMRDRMILFRDLFDLDDCFRCLLSGSVFHGGDPAVAGNWQLPAEFFEKYWFLTIDYNLRRYTNEWRKKQGLEEIQLPTASTDIPPHDQQPEMSQIQLANGLSMMGISSNHTMPPPPSIWDNYNFMMSVPTHMSHTPF